MKVGDIVVFKAKVFGPAYAPYYDEYKGHRFVVRRIVGGHIYVAYADGTGAKDFMVHDDEVELV